jgi:putative salt-induced outer membrane protein YdiY
MRNLLRAAAIAVLSVSAFAQDKIVLSNGDVLTGTIKTMADGKVVIVSPALGDVTVPMANIADMTTQAQVDLENKNGELWKRRVLGIEGGALRLEGDSSLSLNNLGRINPPLQEPTWTGSVQLNGLFASGNTDRRAIGGMIDASLRRTQDRITFDAMFDYADNKDPATREWLLNQRRAGAGLKYDYFLSKKMYTWVTGRVLGDTLADLQLRFTGGTGIGYNWVENDRTTFLTEVGLAYVNENYRSNTPSTDYLSARVYYKLTHKLSDTSRLVHSTEAFPSLEDSGDVYAQVRTELQTSLTKSMIASLAHVLDYDNTPAPGRERQDHRFLLSVGWTF